MSRARSAAVRFVRARTAVLMCFSLLVLGVERATANGSRIILLYADGGQRLYDIRDQVRSEGRGPGDGLGAQPDDSSRRTQSIRTVDGRTAAVSMTLGQLVAYWSEAPQKGYSGIGIDEFGGRDSRLNAKMATALAFLRLRYPHLFIAVWQAGRLSPELARAYRADANLVVIEAYASSTWELSRASRDNIAVAREAGIARKTVIGLGVNDLGQRARGSWANTSEVLRAEIEWSLAEMPDSPGIALFVSRARLPLQRSSYDLAVRLLADSRKTVKRRRLCGGGLGAERRRAYSPLRQPTTTLVTRSCSGRSSFIEREGFAEDGSTSDRRGRTG